MFDKKYMENLELLKSVLKIEFITLLVLIILWIWSTHYIIAKQSNIIADKVTKNMLQIEYNKVWWEENFKKLNEIQKKQIKWFLKQYENQNKTPTISPNTNTNTNTNK